MVDAEGTEPKASGFPVEEAAEDTWRVEAGDAQPVDRSIGGRERARVPVG